jgi:hypothetical protein
MTQLPRPRPTHLRKLLALFSIVGSASLLSGCFTGAALLQSYQIADLDRKPDIHLVKEVDIEVEGQLETVRATWTCSQHMGFSMGSMNWGMHWKVNDPGGVVVKTLPSGDRLVMKKFEGNYDCSPTSKGGGLWLVRAAAPALLEPILNSPQDGRVKRSVVRETAVPEQINLSEQDDMASRLVFQQLRSGQYAFVRAWVWDESDWGTNPELQNKLGSLTDVTLASSLFPPSLNKGQNIGPVIPSFNLKLTTARQMTVPLIDGVARLSEVPVKQVLPSETEAGRRPVIRGLSRKPPSAAEQPSFCFKGTCWPIGGHIYGSRSYYEMGDNEFYDPQTRQIVRVYVLFGER